MAAVGVAVMTRAVPQSRDVDAPAVDWAGSAIIAAAIAVGVMALLDAPHRGWDHPLTVAGVAVGVGLTWLFVVVERRRPTPLLDVNVFGDRRFAAAVVTVMALFASTFGFFYLAMQYAQLTLGYSALSAAVAFAPFAVPVVALSALSFRWDLRWVLTSGLGLIAVGFASILLLQQDSSYTILAITVLTIGSGIGLCTASATSTIMAAVRDERQGLGSAINDAAREIGAAIGIAVAGSVLADRYAHNVTSLPEPLRNSSGQALQIAAAMGPGGARMREVAMTAFLTATHTAAVVLAIAAGGAAVWVAWRAPRTEKGAEKCLTASSKR